MKTLNRITQSKAGQGITELALIIPFLLLLALGVIEVSNMINSYLTLTHLTREGANMVSRGVEPDDGNPDYGNTGAAGYDALDAVVDSSSPVITPGNDAQWLIIYTQIAPDPGAPGSYIVTAQSSRGLLGGEVSKVGGVGGSVVLDMSGVDPGQTFEAVEVFYNYAPDPCSGTLNCPLTPLQSFAGYFFTPMSLPTIFYDRTIFTNVSGVG